MEKLIKLKASVLKLSTTEFAEFREWLRKHEDKKWDIQIEKDIKDKKLEDLSKNALIHFKQGKFKQI